MFKKSFIFIFILCLSTLLVGCGKKDYDMSNITFEDVTITYDGNYHSIEIDGILPEGVSVTYSGNNQIEVGTYTITASFHGNYEKYNEIADMTATLTIVKATADSIRFTEKTVTYTGEPFSILATGVPYGVEVEYIGNNKTNVGSYEVTAIFTDTTGHYEDIPNMTATLTINKKQITSSSIEFKDKTVTYDGNTHYIYVTGLPEGIEINYTDNNKINAGTYTVIAHFTDTTGNYDIVEQKTATLKINKLTINMNSLSYTQSNFKYDGSAHSVYVINLPTGVTANYTNNNQTNVGNYTVGITLVDSTGNYNVGSTTKQLVITKGVHDLSNIKFENSEVLYNEQPHSILIQGTLPTGVSVKYENNNQVNIGTYKIKAIFTVDTTCYENIPTMTATLTISENPQYAKLTFVGNENQVFYVLKGTAFTNAPELEKRNGYIESWDADLTNITTDLVIHSKYTPISYNITYVLNGGEATNYNTYTIESSFTLTNPTKKGYTFIGWTSEDSEELQQTVTITNQTGNKTFTAHWEASEYTISNIDYAPVKVYFKDVDDTTIYYTRTVTKGNTIDIPTKVEKDGFVLTGWYKDKECTQLYKFNEALYEDLTLYAGLHSDSNLLYTCYGERNTIDPSKYLSLTDFYSLKMIQYTTSQLRQTITFVINETRVKNRDLPYRVYYRNDNGHNTTYPYTINMHIYNETTQTSIKTATLEDSDIYEYTQFYAKTGDVISIYVYSSYTNTFYTYFENFNTIEYNTTLSTEKTVVYGANYQLPHIDIIGKTFEGYYTLENGQGEKLTDGKGQSLTPYDLENNVVVYPYYTYNTYNITYNTYDGELEDQTKDYIYQFNIDTEDIVLPNMVKEGYVFDGWYLDKDFNEKIEVIEKGTYKDIEVFAKYIANKYMITGLAIESISVNFDAQNDTEVQTQTVMFGSSLQIPEQPVKTGYIFTGWYLDKECTQIFDFTGKITNMTLYAGWMAKSDMLYSSTYSHSEIEPTSYTTRSNFYRLYARSDTLSTKPARATFRINETKTGTNTFKLYYNFEETSTSFNVYFSVYNETQKKYIFENALVSCVEGEKYISFNANNGDIISVYAYRGKVNTYNTVKIYFKNFTQTTSNTTMEAEKEVTFNENFTLPYVAVEGKEFIGYFTEENGAGVQITDNLGNSLNKYNYANTIKVYAYYK